MKVALLYLPLFFLLAASVVAKAETQKAHTHGLATFTLVLEKGMVDIEFESPAANLIGFEHKATTQKERDAVVKMKSRLQQVKYLFSFLGIHCEAKKITVDVSSVISSEYDEHQHHGDSEVHEHEPKSHNHGKSRHSEISAHYRFSCKDSEQLNSLSAMFFKQFPRIEKIDAMWITETEQGTISLTPTNNKILLKQ